MERDLSFATWNTRGIKNPRNSPNKLSTLLDKLSKLGVEIVFIQETHIGPESYRLLEKVKGWHVYFTVHSPRSKGVAILIRDEVPFEYICHDEDHSGGYIILFCHLHGQLFTLVNVYNHIKDMEVLDRLKDYLKETAEGVLVVGGDFNTVLDAELDRNSSACKAGQTALRAILERFTNSLNLREVWSHLHPTEKDYTRCQGNSFSRLDMFFMQEDTMGRVVTCDIDKTANKCNISDHNPLILTLRIQQKTAKKIPKVASMLEEFGYRAKTEDGGPGKITGTEILSAIESLTNLEENRPDGLQVEYYHMYRSPMTEILKINYNLMLKNNSVPEKFKDYRKTEGRYIYNVDYLIFTQIFAKRLKVFITPSFWTRRKSKFTTSLKITLAKPLWKVKTSFLNNCLKKLKPIRPTPTKNFSFLKAILPVVRGHSEEVRYLHNGCPLTTTILLLALNQLKHDIEPFIDTASICPFRKTLLIYVDNQNVEAILTLLLKFTERSGIGVDHKYCPRRRQQSDYQGPK